MEKKIYMLKHIQQVFIKKKKAVQQQIKTQLMT